MCCSANFSPALKGIQVGILTTIPPPDVVRTRKLLVLRRLVSLTLPIPGISMYLIAKILPDGDVALGVIR